MSKIIIITGFLGSGKTSILLQFARALSKRCGERENCIAIIENEIGQVSLDDRIVEQTGMQVSNLTSGCVCCSLIGSLHKTIWEIDKRFGPDYILLETTGLASPHSIMDMLELQGIQSSACCVIDASRWLKIKGIQDPDLIEYQVGDSHILVVNKVDKVDAETISEVIESLREYNASAPIIEMNAREEISSEQLDLLIDVLSNREGEA